MLYTRRNTWFSVLCRIVLQLDYVCTLSLCYVVYCLCGSIALRCMLLHHTKVLNCPLGTNTFYLNRITFYNVNFRFPKYSNFHDKRVDYSYIACLEMWAHQQDSCSFSIRIIIKKHCFNLVFECQHSQPFAMTSAVCPIFLFAMTVDSQWSSAYCVLLRAGYDSLSESSLGVTHG